MHNKLNFSAWERKTLEKFAGDCYDKLCEQDELRQQLQNDLKDSIEAYRALNRKLVCPACQLSKIAF